VDPRENFGSIFTGETHDIPPTIDSVFWNRTFNNISNHLTLLGLRFFWYAGGAWTCQCFFLVASRPQGAGTWSTKMLGVNDGLPPKVDRVGWRGALASSIDQLERLPKTASHLFTHGVLPVGAVSTGLLYISLLSLEGRI
jgi:hypothetical protein